MIYLHNEALKTEVEAYQVKGTEKLSWNIPSWIIPHLSSFGIEGIKVSCYPEESIKLAKSGDYIFRFTEDLTDTIHVATKKYFETNYGLKHSDYGYEYCDACGREYYD